MDQVAPVETTDSAWKNLYKAGGAAALVVALLLLIEIIIFRRLSAAKYSNRLLQAVLKQ